MPFQACLVSQCGCQMGLSQPHATDKNNVAFVVNELQSEQVLNLGPVNFFGPGPIELIQCLDDREPRHPDATLDGAIMT